MFTMYIGRRYTRALVTGDRIVFQIDRLMKNWTIFYIEWTASMRHFVFYCVASRCPLLPWRTDSQRLLYWLTDQVTRNITLRTSQPRDSIHLHTYMIFFASQVHPTLVFRSLNFFSSKAKPGARRAREGKSWLCGAQSEGTRPKPRTKEKVKRYYWVALSSSSSSPVLLFLILASIL